MPPADRYNLASYLRARNSSEASTQPWRATEERLNPPPREETSGFTQAAAEEEKAGSEAETAAKAKKAPARMPLGQDKGSKDVSAKAAELGLYQ